MPIKEFFNQHKKPIIYWLTLGAVVLVAGGLIWWSTNKQEYPSPDLQILVNNSGYCEQDSDCVLVSKYDGCCRTCDLKVVNTKEKERLERYMETISWCATVDVDCPKIKCPIYNYEVVCEQNKCMIKEKQQQQIDIDTSDWKTYRNTQYGFEVQYPDGWSVYADEARYFESERSDPRFSVTEPGSTKDSKCYASFIFKDLGDPEKNTYSLFSEADKKQKCQQVLDQILSTFRFLEQNTDN